MVTTADLPTQKKHVTLFPTESCSGIRNTVPVLRHLELYAICDTIQSN